MNTIRDRTRNSYDIEAEITKINDGLEFAADQGETSHVVKYDLDHDKSPGDQVFPENLVGRSYEIYDRLCKAGYDIEIIRERYRKTHSHPRYEWENLCLKYEYVYNMRVSW